MIWYIVDLWKPPENDKLWRTFEDELRFSGGEESQFVDGWLKFPAITIFLNWSPTPKSSATASEKQV